MTTPSGLRPMAEFDPSQPAILHDRSTDRIESWTGELAEDFRRHATAQLEGAVAWRGRLFDGWGNVLGG